MNIKKKRLAAYDENDSSYTGSPAVKSVTRYVIDGQTFTTFEEALQSRENKIEQFLCPLLNTLSTVSARERIALVDWIVTNRVELGKLLDY